MPLAKAGGNPQAYENWRSIHVVFAPANTPRDAVQILSGAFVDVLNQPQVQAQFRANGVDTAPMPWNEIAPLAVRLVKSAKELAQAAGIKPE